MVEAALLKDKAALWLKFNGWQFRGFDDAEIAMIEGVILCLIEKRSLWSKATDEVKAAPKHVDKLKSWTLAFTALTGMLAFGLDELLGSAVDWIKDTVTDKGQRDKLLEEAERLKKEIAKAEGRF